MSMDARPTQRSVESSMPAACSKILRIDAGLRNGPMPSMTNIRPKATARSCHMAASVSARTQRRSWHSGLPLRALEVLEEIRVGLQHQDVVLAVEAGAVGVQAAIEAVELLVGTVGRGVDLGCTGIAFAASALRFTIGIGQD